MDALSVCVRSNFAGTESVKMYAEVSLCTLGFFRSLLTISRPSMGPNSWSKHI